MYSNWAPGEPDADLNEDFVEMFATAQWNDSTDGEALNQGYLVEYPVRPDRAGAADPLLIATQATAGSPGEPVVRHSVLVQSFLIRWLASAASGSGGTASDRSLRNCS